MHKEKIKFFTVNLVDIEGPGTKRPPPYGLGCILEGTAGRVKASILFHVNFLKNPVSISA